LKVGCWSTDDDVIDWWMFLLGHSSEECWRGKRSHPAVSAGSQNQAPTKWGSI